MANEPLAPKDTDFYNFPNVPATPSGVPGVTWRGRGQIEPAREKMTTTEQSYATAPALGDLLKRYSAIAAFVGLVFLGLPVAGAFFMARVPRAVPAVLSGRLLALVRSGRRLPRSALMTQYLTGGAWGLVIRRSLEAGAKNLYVFGSCFSCRC